MSLMDTATTPNVDEVIKSMAGSKEDEQKMLAEFEKKYKDCREARLRFEREWYLNLSFYFGKQWVSWVGSKDMEFSRLHEPAAPPWRVRLTSNKIKPIIRKELAKVNLEQPRGFVIPSSSDDKDIAAAKAGDAIHEHVIREIKLSKIKWNASFWTLLCGTSFIKDWYDPGLVGPDGVMGSIKAEAISPFHILVPDMETVELEDQPYIIHALTKDPDWVEQRFKKKIAPDSDGNSGLLETKFLSALGIDNGRSGKKQIVVKEIWIKPSNKYPTGLVAMWAGTTLLHSSEGFPYTHGEYPFSKLDHIATGRFYGQSTIVDLIPLQKEYNRTRSQIIEAKNRMSKPQLIAPRGSVDPRRITTEPGLIIFYRPGFAPPQPLPLQSLPSYVMEEVDRNQRDMDDVSSQHEVSQGRVPPGVEAATAIAYLQEQDDSVLATTTQSLEAAAEKIGKHILSHAGQFWDAERTIRVVGQNSMFESFVFKAADLAGNTDFKVVSGSATPRSRAAKQAHIMELIKMQIIPPDRGLQFLEGAETNRLYEEMQVDVRQAQRENLKMQHGVDVPPNIYDEHALHIVEHDAYRKRQEFEQLDEQIKQMFNMHVEMHKQQIAMEAGQMFEPGDPRLTGFIKGSVAGPPQEGETEPEQSAPPTLPGS